MYITPTSLNCRPQTPGRAPAQVSSFLQNERRTRQAFFKDSRHVVERKRWRKFKEEDVATTEGHKSASQSVNGASPCSLAAAPATFWKVQTGRWAASSPRHQSVRPPVPHVPSNNFTNTLSWMRPSTPHPHPAPHVRPRWALPSALLHHSLRTLFPALGPWRPSSSFWHKRATRGGGRGVARPLQSQDEELIPSGLAGYSVFSHFTGSGSWEIRIICCTLNKWL